MLKQDYQRKKSYCVSFVIENPPDEEWDWVDHAVFEETGIVSNGDFGDGCTATYDFEDREVAVEVLECLKNKKVIGKSFKFKISNVKIFCLVPVDAPKYWEEAPFQ